MHFNPCDIFDLSFASDFQGAGFGLTAYIPSRLQMEKRSRALERKDY